MTIKPSLCIFLIYCILLQKQIKCHTSTEKYHYTKTESLTCTKNRYANTKNYHMTIGTHFPLCFRVQDILTNALSNLATKNSRWHSKSITRHPRRVLPKMMTFSPQLR